MQGGLFMFDLNDETPVSYLQAYLALQLLGRLKQNEQR
jgi:hypothetical protein